MPIELLSNISQKNRADNISSTAFFYLMDTSNIDYRVVSIQENNTAPSSLENGSKYIIRNKDLLHASFTGPNGPITGLDNNDIIMYQNTGFVLYVDVSNTKTNQGGIVYNDSDDKLYYFNGTYWRSLGLGSLVGTPNQISVSGATADIKIALTPIVVIENYIQTPSVRFSNGVTMEQSAEQETIQLLGNLNITGNLVVDGTVTTKTAFTGYTLNSQLESVINVSVDSGDY